MNSMREVSAVEQVADAGSAAESGNAVAAAKIGAAKNTTAGKGNGKGRRRKKASLVVANEVNEQKLRAAMDRLLAGQSLHTNGRLTVGNLADEAGLTRPTAYRCEAVIEEFNEHVRRIAERDEAPSEEHLKRIVKMRGELKEEKERSARYREDAKAARAAQQALANQVVVLDEKLRRSESQQKKQQ